MHYKPSPSARRPDSLSTEAEAEAAPGFSGIAPPWPESVTRALDIVAAVVAGVLAVVVALDAGLPGRPVLALVFYLAVPGWVGLRSLRLPGSSLLAFCAIGGSVSGTLLLGQVLVTLTDWAWQPATVVIAALCVVGSVHVLVRP